MSPVSLKSRILPTFFLLITACGLNESINSEIETRVTVTVTDEERNPVKGAVVTIPGITEIKTGEDGTATHTVRTKAGNSIRTRIECPPGSTLSSTAVPAYHVGTGRSLDGGRPGLHHHAECISDIFRMQVNRR